MKKLFIFASLLYSFAAQANSSYFENLVRQMQAHQNDPLIADMELQTGNENISYRVYKKGKRVRTDFTMNDVTGYTFTDDHKTTFFIPAQNVLTVQENEGGSPFLIPDAQTFEGCSVGSPIQINGMECRPIKCSNAGEQLDLCISETFCAGMKKVVL